MHVFLDFETRSLVDLRKCGAARYAADPSTIALMLAYAVDPDDVRQWVYDIENDTAPPLPDDLLAWIANPAVIFHAHNAAFEYYVWQRVMHERYGFPAIPRKRWRCTAAKAAYANMPRSLDGVSTRLGLADEKKKSHEGRRLITRLAQPVIVGCKQAVALADECFEHDGRLRRWVNDADEHEAFRAYNRQDVVAEMAVDESLPAWNENEQQVWLLDRKINERGIPVDVPLCYGAVQIHAEAVKRANAKLEEITGGAVTAYSQVNRILAWLHTRGVRPGTLAEAEVVKWLTTLELPKDAAAVMKLRLLAGSATVKKYKAALNAVEGDERIREAALYYGAATGRWAGRGLQPHNFKRAAVPAEMYFEAIKSGSFDLADCMAGDDPKLKNVVGLLKACIRGIIKAPEGRKLVISDFAGIESRVLQWLAGGERALKLFRDGQDVYLDAACHIFDVTIDQIADKNESGKWALKPDIIVDGRKGSDMRQLGKIATLGLGYGMGAEKFAATVELQAGIKIDEDFAKEVVTKWRDANSEVVRTWHQLQKACVATIQKKRAHRLGKLITRWDDMGYLAIQLPSGRDLFYYAATVVPGPWAGAWEIRYLDGSKQDSQSAYVKTYGGKLVENVVQAVARDLLVHSMHLIDAGGLDLILHVHDETVTEVDADDQDALPFIHKCMTTLPDWAAGLPLEAETHESIRYTK